MNFSRFTFLIFVLSILTIPVMSQQLIISEKNFTYPFVLNSQTVSNVFAERVLQKLSIHNEINISFSVDLSVKVTQLSQYQFVAMAEVRYDECKGNFLYRNFELCSDFYPEYLDFGFEINQAFQSKNSIDISFHNSPSETIRTIFSWIDSTGNKIPEIKPIFKNIRYDEFWEQKINQKINRIELYYKSDSLFKLWNEAIDNINLDQTELLPIHDFTLDDIEKEFEFFNDQNIYSILNPTLESHHVFSNKMNDINQKISRKRYLLDEYLHRIDFRFIESARESIKKSNVEKAIYFYQKALEFHPYSIIALKELGQIFLNQERLSDASELLKIIFSKTWPHEKLYVECVHLAQNVYQSILTKGDEWISEEEFHRAIEVYSVALIFCDSIREPICNASHKQGIINAKKGILNSYFNVINKSLERNRMDIAENYVRESKKYQLANQKELPDDAEIQAMADKVVSRYVNEAIINIQKAQFSKAIRQLDNADSLGYSFRENFSLAYLNESREKAFSGAFSVALKETKMQLEMGNIVLADAKYDAAMDFYFKHPEWIKDTTEAYALFVNIRQAESLKKTDWGNILYSKAEYSSALLSLQEAKSIEQKFKLSENRLLDSLLFVISKPIAFEKLNSVGMKIWRNELLDAKKIIDEVQTLIIKSNLEKNLDLMKLFNSVSENYESQKCIFANSEIQKLENEYFNYRNENAYINAKQSVENIIKIQNEFGECIQSPKRYDDAMQFLIPASEYENLIRDSSIEFRLENYSLALRNYFKADSLFEGNMLDKNGVRRSSLSSFFYQSIENKPIFSALSNSILYQKPEYAFELFELLKKRGVKSFETRIVQKQLASFLKNRDKISVPSLTKFERLKQYPVSGKWFLWFRVYYIL
ncbi:MAG: hypothetical protein PHY85_03870 [Bacteroidales bacterium]|nr:hypothetical protein [Bacteroidales bacterium]